MNYTQEKIFLHLQDPCIMYKQKVVIINQLNIYTLSVLKTDSTTFFY